MRYVIVNVDGTLFRTRQGKESYANQAAAKAALTRMLNNQEYSLEWGARVVSQADYLQNRPMKRVRNLMSGKEIEIPADTPPYLDPSCESYWTM